MRWKAHGTVIYQQIAARSLASLPPNCTAERSGGGPPSLSVDKTLAQPLSEYRVAHVVDDVSE